MGSPVLGLVRTPRGSVESAAVFIGKAGAGPGPSTKGIPLIDGASNELTVGRGACSFIIDSEDKIPDRSLT